MMNVTYAKGQIVEIDEELRALEVKANAFMSPIRDRFFCRKAEEIDYEETRTLLNELEKIAARITLLKTEKTQIKERWGIR